MQEQLQHGLVPKARRRGEVRDAEEALHARVVDRGRQGPPDLRRLKRERRIRGGDALELAPSEECAQRG